MKNFSLKPPISAIAIKKPLKPVAKWYESNYFIYGSIGAVILIIALIAFMPKKKIV